jgi:hypothetical protein
MEPRSSLMLEGPSIDDSEGDRIIPRRKFDIGSQQCGGPATGRGQIDHTFVEAGHGQRR